MRQSLSSGKSKKRDFHGWPCVAPDPWICSRRLGAARLPEAHAPRWCAATDTELWPGHDVELEGLCRTRAHKRPAPVLCRLQPAREHRRHQSERRGRPSSRITNGPCICAADSRLSCNAVAPRRCLPAVNTQSIDSGYAAGKGLCRSAPFVE